MTPRFHWQKMLVDELLAFYEPQHIYFFYQAKVNRDSLYLQKWYGALGRLNDIYVKFYYHFKKLMESDTQQSIDAFLVMLKSDIHEFSLFEASFPKIYSQLDELNSWFEHVSKEKVFNPLYEPFDFKNLCLVGNTQFAKLDPIHIPSYVNVIQKYMDDFKQIVSPYLNSNRPKVKPVNIKTATIQPSNPLEIKEFEFSFGFEIAECKTTELQIKYIKRQITEINESIYSVKDFSPSEQPWWIESKHKHLAFYKHKLKILKSKLSNETLSVLPNIQSNKPSPTSRTPAIMVLFTSPIFKISGEPANEFDIICPNKVCESGNPANPIISGTTICQNCFSNALLKFLPKIRKSQRQAFIDYQVEQQIDKKTWLKQLHDFVIDNEKHLNRFESDTSTNYIRIIEEQIAAYLPGIANGNVSGQNLTAHYSARSSYFYLQMESLKHPIPQIAYLRVEIEKIEIEIESYLSNKLSFQSENCSEALKYLTNLQMDLSKLEKEANFITNDNFESHLNINQQTPHTPNTANVESANDKPADKLKVISHSFTLKLKGLPQKKLLEIFNDHLKDLNAYSIIILNENTTAAQFVNISSGIAVSTKIDWIAKPLSALNYYHSLLYKDVFEKSVDSHWDVAANCYLYKGKTITGDSLKSNHHKLNKGFKDFLTQQVTDLNEKLRIAFEDVEQSH